MTHEDRSRGARPHRGHDAERNASTQGAAQRAVAPADETRSAAVAQRQLMDVIEQSPRVADSRALSNSIDGTGYLVAQREQIQNLFGHPAQRQAVSEEDEPLQARRAPAQLEAAPAAGHGTGLPAGLKSGIESLSGLAMDDVKVHYNSSRPAQLGALAHAQGKDIHIAQGQEQHLPHEAWHVVQQAQGRVRPTIQSKDGTAINDDPALEQEADAMGARAAQMKSAEQGVLPAQLVASAAGGLQSEAAVVQLRHGTLDASRVHDGQTIPLDHAHFGGLTAAYRGLHITLLPTRAGGNTVHITAYEFPNPAAGGPRTYNWYNPATGVWGGWTSGNPLATPGNLAALLTHVEGIIDFYLAPDVAAPSALLAGDFPDLNAKTTQELQKEKREEERRLKRQAEIAAKKAAQEKLKRERAEREEAQRLARLRERQRVEYAEDIALGMELADMYGWSEATVFEMAVQGDFRDQVLARKSVKEPPSYIS